MGSSAFRLRPKCFPGETAGMISSLLESMSTIDIFAGEIQRKMLMCGCIAGNISNISPLFIQMVPVICTI